MLFERISDSITLDAVPDMSLLQGTSDTAAIIRQIVETLNGFGAQIHASSRLHQYARMFEADDDPSTVQLDHALLESLQFLAVGRALKNLKYVKPWLSKINSASRGRAVASDDKTDSRARSDQFELFVMACLTEAGFAVVPAEPDLRSQIGTHEAAFAAKRLRSVQKLRRNLHDACKQLAVHKRPGFVVIDLSFVNRMTKPTYVPHLGQQQAIAAVMLDGFVEEQQREIFDVAKRPYVSGVILHASVVGRSIEPVARFVSRRWLLCAGHDSELARIVGAAFQRIGRRPIRAF
ncbi:MAG: hypothetical protein L0Y42_00320 [Phycisphaerales bacterium]|nr:hypothetical protein [Phycisphaerales bacterium]